MIAAAALSAAACGGTDTPQDETMQLAQDGSDTSSAEGDTEAMVTSFVSGSGSVLSLASANHLIGGGLHLDDYGAGAKADYFPSACLQVANDASSSTTTYVFDQCNGPFGLDLMTGTVTVKYATTPTNTLVLDFAATKLSVNHATLDWSAHAEITAGDLGKRMMTWTGSFSGTTARNHACTRTTNKVVEWTVGQSCVLVNGTSDGSVAARTVHTDVIGYSRCKGECPGAGSEIKITDTKTDRSVDIKYDGSRVATFTTPAGTQTQFTLACGL